MLQSLALEHWGDQFEDYTCFRIYAWLKSHSRKYCSMIYYERKTLLKKKIESSDKLKQTGQDSTHPVDKPKFEAPILNFQPLLI